jgi:hypothetical protein
MLPFLALHSNLAKNRGDGLRPELQALFERHVRSDVGLFAVIESVEAGSSAEGSNADSIQPEQSANVSSSE